MRLIDELRTQTFQELRAAIKRAKHVYIQARFGSSERWLRITKREALFLVAGYTSNDPLLNDETFSWGARDGLDLFIGG